MSAHGPPLPKSAPPPDLRERLRGMGVLLEHLPGTFALVWQADRRGTIILGALTTVAALLPVGMAYLGKLIVDAVVASAKDGGGSERVLRLVALELLLVACSTAVTRGLGLLRELLRAKLGNVVNLRILEKSLQLELRHFEDSEVYDKMQNARREASVRPLSLVLQSFSVVQNLVTLTSFAALLVRLSPWSVVVLLAASIPSFLAEARLAAASFKLNTWRAPEGRRLNYLEWVLTRDSYVKEVKLLGIGALVLGRYKALYQKFYEEDRALAVRRMLWGLGLGLLAALAFYGLYAVVAGRASRAEISLGDMTLYLAVFRQGQTAFQAILSAIGSMYEDALFMSNLFLFLALPTGAVRPRLAVPRSPPRGRGNTLELRDVSFRYPGKKELALDGVSLSLRPGEKLGLVGENGAGKSTLVKLLMRLYEPTGGEILYGGVDLRDMAVEDLRSRLGAVFQDFVRYQFTASENIGLGEVSFLEDEARIRQAAQAGGAASVIEALPHGYQSMLGGWFEAGQELSAGQWQKLAVSRAFMREDAEVLVLDEPTASIDAQAEHELFLRFSELSADRMAIIISHRFSTVRMADRIAVLHQGKLEALGSHRELMEQEGRYAQLFELQARGYRD